MSPKQREKFLAALGDGLTVKDAAAEGGMARQTFYRLRRDDAEFAADWDDAEDEGTDVLEREARRRAVDGIEDFKMAGDTMVPILRYSDTLLIFLLKARKPSKFRDNVKVEHGGSDKPIVIEHRGVKLSDILDAARRTGLEPGD